VRTGLGLVGNPVRAVDLIAGGWLFKALKMGYKFLPATSAAQPLKVSGHKFGDTV